MKSASLFYRVAQVISGIAITFLLFNCTSDDNHTCSDQAFQNVIIESNLISRLGVGLPEGLTEPRFVLIDNENDFDTLISEFDRGLSGVSHRDFMNYIPTNYQDSVVIAVIDEISNVGTSVWIEKIVEYENEILIEVVSNQGTATLLSQPYQISQMAKQTKPIRFIDNTIAQ
jgi:hypothetical protein